MLDELAVQVVKTLTLCEKAGLANRTVDLDDDEVIEIYVATLAAHGITAQALRGAQASILIQKFFPRPGDLVELAKPVQERMQHERKRNWYRSLVDAVDGKGHPVLAPPDRVRDGVLVPRGDPTANGRPAPVLPTKQPTEQGRALLQIVISGEGDGNDGIRRLSGNNEG